MSRPRGPQGPGISLFPFLAVLLCTMGSLLVLLVIFSRSASQQASSVDAAQLEELTAERSAIEQHLRQLAVAKAQAVDGLSKARLQLAGIEEHARKLQDELSSLEKMAKALVADAGDARDADEREALRRKLAEAREKLEKAKKEASSKPPAYAVVPYEGSLGTHRRPLYIECSVDGVFLQPEGIRLRPSDFEGPPGPGNPLASALRAAREHIAAANAASAAPDAQPYPLLLVRPSGVMAYYAAREAITSWGSEFGYQLIDEDWQIAFPPPDPALADVERRAVDEARARLQWLAEVRPARPSKPAVKYRAATTRGGVVASGGPSVLGEQSQFEWTDAQADRAGTGTSSGGSVFGRGNGNGNGNGTGSGSGDGTEPMDRATADRLVVGGGTGSRGSGRGGPAGSAPAGSATQQGGMLVGQDSQGSQGGQGGPGGQRGETANSAGQASLGSAGTAEGSSGGRHDGDAAGGTAADVQSRFGNGSGGAASGAMASAQAASGEAGAGSSAAGGSSSSGSQPPPGATSMPTPGMLQVGGGSSGNASGSLAQSRGSNWASLATRDTPVPLSRPIQIECAADEFRVYDDSRKRIVSRVPISGHTATAIDPLVKVVHGRVASWGLAGDRMYWKPQLLLSETVDGHGRRADLERLLADSGIETIHGHSVVAPLPAVTQGHPAPPGKIR